MDRDELALARLDSSAFLYGRDARRLVIAALGSGAIGLEGEDEDGFYVEILGQRVRTAGELRDLAERVKRGEFGEGEQYSG
jgi:hypothetical protein